MYWRQSGFIYSACRPCTKNKKKNVKILKKQDIHDILSKNELEISSIVNEVIRTIISLSFFL